jgi:hypothetical protein
MSSLDGMQRAVTVRVALAGAMTGIEMRRYSIVKRRAVLSELP